MLQAKELSYWVALFEPAWQDMWTMCIFSALITTTALAIKTSDTAKRDQVEVEKHLTQAHG